MSEEGDAFHHVLREIERDVEALLRLIERAIDRLESDWAAAEIERLVSAKEALERVARLTRSSGFDRT